VIYIRCAKPAAPPIQALQGWRPVINFKTAKLRGLEVLTKRA